MSLLFALVLAFATAQKLNIASTVSAYISAMPQCGQTCIKTLPEWVDPLTDSAVIAVCNNVKTALQTFNTCINTGCTGSDLKKASAVPSLCGELQTLTSISKNSTIANPSTNLATQNVTSASSIASSKAAGITSNLGSGASGITASLAFVFVFVFLQ